MQTSAGSQVLRGYRPPFDATAAARLKGAGAVLVGKTNMDEFGMGSSTENSSYHVHNALPTKDLPYPAIHLSIPKHKPKIYASESRP